MDSKQSQQSAGAEVSVLSPYDWRVFKRIPDERSYSGTKIDELLTEYTADLQAELAVQKEWSRKLAQDADKVAADWRAAEAQNRVLAEALRRYKHALSPWTTQYAREVTREQHLEMLAATEAAERALAPGQEEK